MTREQLFETAKLLPATPGVYIMHGRDKTVIYVGKSKALQHRVSSYFAPYAKHNIKTQHMVAAVSYFEVYHTSTELEALILENQFIKQYMPRYNIKLKDSSAYPYIELTAGDYPSLNVVYSREHADSRYFGPYSSAGTAWSIVSAARKAFRLPSCKKQFPADIGKGRPCLNYHINQCMGVCVRSNISKDDYAAVIADTVRFLRGDYGRLVSELEARMLDYSEKLWFEKAAKLRDTIASVKKIRDRQHIIAAPNIDADVIGCYSDDLGSALTVFFVRGGAVIDRECLFFGADELFESGAVTSLLYRFYTLGGFVPGEIYTDSMFSEEDAKLLADELGSVGKVSVSVPQKGEKRKLVELANDNARELMLHKRETESKATRFLAGLAEFLGLEVLPERIEAYDVSNHGDEDIVCGMVVWEKTRFVKKKYRTFTMKTVDFRDDYASMREALDRRLKHSDGDWAYPDLILLDGGNGHVSVIKQLFEERGIEIPVFGMIKDEHHKTRVLTDGENEIGLHKRQDIFNFIYKFQEEVHETAFKSMDTKRRSKLKTSSLTEIAGVGDVTAKKLLAYFGGLKGIKTASAEELASVAGVSQKAAENVYGHFHGEKGKEKDSK